MELARGTGQDGGKKSGKGLDARARGGFKKVVRIKGARWVNGRRFHVCVCACVGRER